MNAVTSSSSAHDFMQDNAGGGSDSDSNPDDLPEYYQPISAEPDDEVLEFSDEHNSSSDNDENNRRFNFHNPLPNGYLHGMENGVLALDLSDEDDSEKEEEGEEERRTTESDVAIRRAFREDESRRNAPLTPENAVRVMEAMRGVSLGGLAPDWAGQISEDRWIDQLRRMRRPSSG